MRKLLTTLVLSATLLPSSALLVGCDDTLEHDKTVKTKDNGDTVTQDKKVTQGSDGTITKTEEKKVDHP